MVTKALLFATKTPTITDSLKRFLKGLSSKAPELPGLFVGKILVQIEWIVKISRKISNLDVFIVFSYNIGSTLKKQKLEVSSDDNRMTGPQSVGPQ